jgi:hypothetical protein
MKIPRSKSLHIGGSSGIFMGNPAIKKKKSG